MKRHESVYRYIDRFNKLCTEYETVIKIDKEKKTSPTHVVSPAPPHNGQPGNHTASNVPTPSNTPSLGHKVDGTSLIDISEITCVKYFISGLHSRTLRRQLRAENHEELKSVQTSIKNICEEDDELVDDSDGADNDSDSNQDDGSDESDYDSDEKEYFDSKYKKGKTTRKGKSATEKSDPELKELVKNMSLMMGEFIKFTQKPGNTSRVSENNGNFACYNCQEKTHRVSECTNPCKLCKDPNHRHYQCSLYVSKKKPDSSPALIAELMMAIREHEVNENIPNVPLEINKVHEEKRVKVKNVPRRPGTNHKL
jgi:hypothetical protein